MQIVEPLLGTRAEVHATAATGELAEKIECSVLDEVRRLERIFTVFTDDSALHELRRTGTTLVPELIEVLDLAERWRQRSKGLFDPSVQSLVELWDQAEAHNRVPAASALAAAVSTIQAHRAAGDNLNAIAKVWIAETAIETAELTATSTHALWLSLGGDVVHRGSYSITVGIEDPHRPYDNVAPLATIAISNEAIATSGGARRWWTIGDRRFAKLLDPRTR